MRIMLEHIWLVVVCVCGYVGVCYAHEENCVGTTKCDRREEKTKKTTKDKQIRSECVSVEIFGPIFRIYDFVVCVCVCCQRLVTLTVTFDICGTFTHTHSFAHTHMEPA